jgi:sulfonate transport system permease protein
MPRLSSEAAGRALRALSVILAFAFIWWLAGSFRWVNPLFLPTLGSLVKAAAGILTSGAIYTDIAQTVYRALAGVAVSAAVAIPVGLLFGRSPKLYDYFELPVDFFRSIPSSSLFFLFVLLFGIGDLSKVAVVFYGCSLIVLVNAIYGGRPTKDKLDRINMLRVFGASRWQISRFAVLPDALPFITAGIRIALSLSFVLVIVTEMFLGASNGLGKAIYDYYLAYRVPEMYAVIILLGLVGFLANWGFGYLEHRLLYWLPK